MSYNKQVCTLKNIAPISIDKFDEQERILRAVANKTRLAILDSLIKYGEVCTCELEPALNFAQPTITAHIHKLYNAGLLKRRIEWKYTYYSITEKYYQFIKKILEL